MRITPLLPHTHVSTCPPCLTRPCHMPDTRPLSASLLFHQSQATAYHTHILCVVAAYIYVSIPKAYVPCGVIMYALRVCVCQHIESALVVLLLRFLYASTVSQKQLPGGLMCTCTVHPKLWRNIAIVATMRRRCRRAFDWQHHCQCRTAACCYTLRTYGENA